MEKNVLRFNTILQQKLGEQKIDIIAHQVEESLNYIHKEAIKTGIIL